LPNPAKPSTPASDAIRASAAASIFAASLTGTGAEAAGAEAGVGDGAAGLPGRGAALVFGGAASALADRAAARGAGDHDVSRSSGATTPTRPVTHGIGATSSCA